MKDKVIRSHRDYHDMSIEQMCKPLSATIMPKARAYNIAGELMASYKINDANGKVAEHALRRLRK